MKSKTSASLLLILTFLLGSAAGAALHFLYSSRTTSAVSETDTRSHTRSGTDDLSKALSLDDSQKAAFNAIIKESRGSYHKLSREFRPRYDAIRQETNEAIREILRPDQQARFDQMLDDIRSTHRSRDRR